MKRTRRAVVALIAVMLMGGGALVAMRRQRAPVTPAPPADIRARSGVRIRVQVLNGTKVRGLARRATMLLRDRGFDVVETGTVTAAIDTTVVLNLSGHADWAATIARLFAPARVQTRPDSSRYLDIAVVLGTSWRPPSEPFYP
jgi:hypothetical protein